ESFGRDGILGKPWAVEKAKKQKTATHFILGFRCFRMDSKVLMRKGWLVMAYIHILNKSTAMKEL
uniref:Ovule protein n=1 Tax=Bursaphelenchus xylophilus TaxID=6326 RepID=A0A1I7SNH6_BURXY